MPDFARKIECLVCVSTSTADCSDLESFAGRKNVGTGTYTPVGGTTGPLRDMMALRGSSGREMAEKFQSTILTM